jgi:hypothetical protein
MTDDQVRAICRIQVFDKTPKRTELSRGTGFLVDRDKVMTAFHVIGDRKTGALLAGQIKLWFPDPAPAGESRKGFAPEVLRIIDKSPQQDWALLECEPVTHAEPFRLRRHDPHYDVEWETFGFSDQAPARGRTYSGKVKLSGHEIQVDVEGIGVNVPGLSGGPCLIRGVAIGMLISGNSPRANYPETQAMFVVPGDVIAAPHPPMLNKKAPHFVSELSSYLKGGEDFLHDVATLALGLAPTPGISPQDLRRRVAEEILNRGITSALDCLGRMVSEIKPAASNMSLRLVWVLWINQEACEKLRTHLAAKGPRNAIAINATQPLTGRWYVQRAGYEIAGYPGWWARTIEIPETSVSEEEVIDQVRRGVAKILGTTPAKVADELAVNDEQRRPITALFPRVPTDAVLSAMATTFASVRVAIMSGPAPASDLGAHIDRVLEPTIPPTAESERYDALDRACKQLANLYTNSPSGSPEA